jgi:hypothetical protein
MAIDENEMPILLDGQTLHKGENIFSRLWSHLLLEHPTNKFFPNAELQELVENIRKQKSGLLKAGGLAEMAAEQLSGQKKRFLETNLLAQQKILLGLLEWVESGAQATLAFKQKDSVQVKKEMLKSVNAFKLIREGQALATQTIFKDWYRGDRKMNLDRAEHITHEVHKLLNN